MEQIPTLKKALLGLQLANQALDGKQKEIEGLLTVAEGLNIQAQKATGGERDHLDGLYQTALRRAERAKGDLPALESAIKGALQVHLEASYLDSIRKFVSAQAIENLVKDDIAKLVGDRDAINQKIQDLETGPLAEARQTPASILSGLRSLEQHYPNNLAELRQRINAQEGQNFPWPG